MPHLNKSCLLIHPRLTGAEEWTHMLEGRGIDLSWAKSTDDAGRLILRGEKRIDAILMPVSLSRHGSEGVEYAKTLREMETGLPIALLATGDEKILDKMPSPSMRSIHIARLDEPEWLDKLLDYLGSKPSRARQIT